MAELFHGAATDLNDDARQLLRDLDREIPGTSFITAGCRPPIDVIETATSVEVVMDAPGVAWSSIRVAIRRSTMVIAGAKSGGSKDPAARYHLAERTSGRFARAVGLGGAFDGTRARAVIHDGQLRIVLPLLEDRRGQLLMIPVEQE